MPSDTSTYSSTHTLPMSSSKEEAILYREQNYKNFLSLYCLAAPYVKQITFLRLGRRCFIL